MAPALPVERIVSQMNGRRGFLLYAVVVMAGVTAVSVALRSMNLSVADRGAAVFIMAAMWTPALGRFAATRTVDRAWQSPFPLRRWGDRKYGVMLMPPANVSVIYLGACGLAWLTGVLRETPVWKGIALVINVAVNLPLLAAFDLIGGLGEELGWRGYLQPRLDEMGVRGSLLWVIGLETLFHIPLILLAGYLADASWATFALLGLGLGATPVWT